MKQKWKDNGGETLVEVLASILIVTLSIALLFSTILASISIDRKARAAEKVFNTSLEKAEEQTTEVTVIDNKVKIETKKLDGTLVTPPDKAEVSVNFYGGKGAWSFVLPAVSATPVTPP